MIRNDRIDKFNVDSKAECDQLNLAHVARDKNIKKTTSNEGQCPLNSEQVQDPLKAVQKNRSIIQNKFR